VRNRIQADECTRAREWVSLRLDSQLSDFEEVLLEAHLARCAECRAFATGTAGLTHALRATPLERPAFTFEAPRRTRGRTVALRAVSAGAAVAVVGISGLVSLQLSAGRARPGAAVERRVIGLKEKQMNELAGLAQRANRQVRPSLAAAEQASFVTGREPAARVVPRGVSSQ
jgi:predicted anti-sigma-YlaC factor YlaD